MTDEKLDRARVAEALRVWRSGAPTCDDDYPIAINAARLAREGWMPPDPLVAEVNELTRAYDGQHGYFVGPITRSILRKALERGIEIGRSKRND